jgi:hypothetical protein
MHSKVRLARLALLLGLQTACAGSDPAGMAPAYEPPTLRLPGPDSHAEVRLSTLGLYEDIADKRVAPDLVAFAPAYPLWTDGAEKQRWLRLPAGAQIDTSDMDHWQFPVGSVLFKEFARDGKRLETRVLARTGPRPEDTWMGAFVWLDDESDALLVRDGARDVRGTAHDVPSQKNCFTCHNGERGRVLGFSAVQQPQAPARLLSHPPAAPYVVPGDPTASAALGYLHANCAHCHNPSGSARPDTDMNLRLSVAETSLRETTPYRSTVSVKLQYFASAPLGLRIAPGNPAESGLAFRMRERGPNTQMPPLGSEQVDPTGIALVHEFISAIAASP